MYIINARNVEDALLQGVELMQNVGPVHRSDSRNGPVLTVAEPLTTRYAYPRERVMFLPAREANPFFHFMECLWMMAGRRDVEFPSRFAGNIANYSDDGVNFHGAYGFRWRHAERLELHGGDIVINEFDQLSTIADALIKNKDDRRVVLQMWDADQDLGKDGKDFPCNLIATFRVNPHGALDLTVFNRSNDMIWGAYGANAVHFSFLQEVMASWIGVPVGQYWQISTNFHMYLNNGMWEKIQHLCDVEPSNMQYSAYETGSVCPYPIVNTPIETWFSELNMFLEEGSVMGFTDPFFKKVASPMLNSWNHWKDKENPDRIEMAIASAENIVAPDWRKACVEWLERRQK